MSRASLAAIAGIPSTNVRHAPFRTLQVWLFLYVAALAASLAVAFAMFTAVVSFAYQRYWLKTPEPANLVKEFLDKQWDAHAAAVFAYVPSQDAAVRAVDATLSFARARGLQLYNALCCTNWMASARVGITFYLLQALLWWLSIPSLLWLGTTSLSLTGGQGSRCPLAPRCPGSRPRTWARRCFGRPARDSPPVTHLPAVTGAVGVCVVPTLCKTQRSMLNEKIALARSKAAEIGAQVYVIRQEFLQRPFETASLSPPPHLRWFRLMHRSCR